MTGEMIRVIKIQASITCYLAKNTCLLLLFESADNPTARQPGKFSASILPSDPQLMNFAVTFTLLRHLPFR